MHSHLDNQILTYLMRVYNNMAHPHHPDPENVRWWIDRCSAKRFNEPRETYTQLRKQVNLIGVDCVTVEESDMKCGAEGLLSREDLFQYLYFLQQSPSWDNCAYQSCSDCSNDVYMRNISRLRTLLNSVVDEIWWEERLSPYNHNPHFPYFVTPFTDSMPICSVGGDLSDVLFNPKYAGHVYKVTVATNKSIMMSMPAPPAPPAPPACRARQPRPPRPPAPPACPARPPWLLSCKGGAPLCTVVAMEDCPQCLDKLCNGAAWPCAYFAPPYSVLHSQTN